MTVRKTLLHAAAAAALFGLTGAAYAAGMNAGAGADTGATPGVHAGAGVGSGSETSNPSLSGSSGSAASQSLVGQDVADSSGDTIGKVSRVSGDQVFIKTEQSLGIGAREIAVPLSDLKQGAGASGGLQLSMTKDELKNMPASTGGASGSTGTGGEGGTGTGGTMHENGSGTDSGGTGSSGSGGSSD